MVCTVSFELPPIPARKFSVFDSSISFHHTPFPQNDVWVHGGWGHSAFISMGQEVSLHWCVHVSMMLFEPDFSVQPRSPLFGLSLIPLTPLSLPGKAGGRWRLIRDNWSPCLLCTPHFSLALCVPLLLQWQGIFFNLLTHHLPLDNPN